MRSTYGSVVLAIFLSTLSAGCFYPPTTKPPAEKINTVRLELPYDLAWKAVHAVMEHNGYRLNAQDPNQGIIEAQGRNFSLKDADCGIIKSGLATYRAEPRNSSSQEFTVTLWPDGPEASTVTLKATFSAPLVVPLRPIKNIHCVSRGVQEARLLREIREESLITHRPTFDPAPQVGASPRPTPAPH